MKHAYPEMQSVHGNINKVSGEIEHNHIAPPFPNNHVFFHLSADNSLDPILNSDKSPTFKFDYVSPSATSITGYTPEEFIADPLLLKKCIPPKDYRRLWDLPLWMNPDKAKPMEIRWKRKDGKMLWTEHLISPVVDEDGNLASLNVMFRDTTERKEADIALLESQQFNASLLENAPHAIVVINPDTSVKYVNPAWEQINGWTLSEIAGIKAPYPWWPEEYKDSFFDAFKLAMEQGSGHGEVISQKKNGEIYWIDINWTSVTNNGELLYLVINSVDITERKKMEEALKESEEKFSKAFHSSPQIMAITTFKEGRFVDVNDSYTRFTGYSREEVIGRKSSELNVWISDADRERMLKMLRETGRVKNEEFKFRAKSGEIRTWLFSAEPVTLGGKDCLIGVSTDITERKKVEEELRESEEKFAKAFNSSPESIAITTIKEGRYIDVNDSYLKRTGYSRKELVGKTTTDVGIWANEADRTKMHKMVREKGRVYNEEFEFRTKSGERRTSLVSMEPINIKGESCLIGVSLDITPRKRIEKALRESEEKFSKAFYSSPDMMAIASLKDSKYAEVNDSYTNCLGYTRKELIGHTADELNIWVDHEETEKIITLMKKHGKIREAEHSVRTKHGQIRNWVCSGDTITINGEPYMIAVAKDITEQKAVEEKLQEHKKMMESILSTMPEGVLVIDGKQNILLANKALHKIFNLNSTSLKKKTLADIFSRKKFFDLHKAVKARKADKKNLEFRYRVDGLEKIIDCVIVKMDGRRTLLCFSDISREREEEEKLYLTDRLASIGEMAAGLAHELNNPLTGILALSQMLSHANLTTEYREDLECINTEAKRAASIVKNVLLFARNKTGENSQSSVNDVVKNVLKLREYEEKASNITVVTNLEENISPVPVDKWQLQQIFLNLISNAEAAIKEVNRPGIITIGTQRTNNHVNIVFSDNGCGIKKQVLPRIFDPFFTTKEIGKGTGLGLSICYSIIVKHGGKINVKSQVNEGTTFTIRLPAVK